MGAWIETQKVSGPNKSSTVAPYVGAWIETLMYQINKAKIASHPTWVRGLKLERVVPVMAEVGRTLRGCVD